jgi:hypothetical protein
MKPHLYEYDRYATTGYQVYAIECGIPSILEELGDNKERAERKLEHYRAHYPDLEIRLLPILERI